VFKSFGVRVAIFFANKADGSEWLEKIETNHSQEGKGEINIKGLFYAIGHTPNTKF